MLRSWTFWRLFLTLVALSLLPIGLVGFVVAGQMDRYERERIAASVRVCALLVREALRGRTDNAGKLQEQARQLADDAGARVTLLAADGRVQADSAEDPATIEDHAERPEIIQAREQGVGTAERLSPTLGQAMLYVAVRADDLGPHVAFVRTAVPLNTIQEQIRSLNRIIWTAIVVVGLAAVALAFWLARRTVRPLTELTEVAQQLAAGDFGRTVYASGRDETATLARSFNHMSRCLAEQFAQLEEDRQQLRAILSGMVEGVIALGADEPHPFRE